MSVYIYKCKEGHEHEETHSMSSYPRSTKCGCGVDATIVIRPRSLFISVDRTGESGFNIGAGTYFHNRHDLKAWENANNAHVMSPEETAPGLQWLRDAREARKDGVVLQYPKAPKPAPLKLKTSGYERLFS